MIAFGRREQYIILALLGVIIFGVGVKFAIAKPASVNPRIVQKEVPREEKSQEEKSQAQIFVHVTGAVQKPGLYQFKEGARVKEALDKAVPTEKADLDAVNLAEILTDGSKIILPEIGQSINQEASGSSTIIKSKARVPSLKSGTPSRTKSGGGSKTSGSSKLSPGEKVNINTADASQLDRLPGVGAATAQKIIDYRNANGGFKSIEEIKKVAGIGDKKYADLSPYLTL